MDQKWSVSHFSLAQGEQAYKASGFLPIPFIGDGRNCVPERPAATWKNIIIFILSSMHFRWENVKAILRLLLNDFRGQYGSTFR